MTLGPVRFDNTLSTFTNNVDISGRLNVEEDSFFNNNLTIRKNVTADNNVIAGNDVSAYNNVIAGNDVSAANNVTAGNNVSAANNVIADNNAIADNNVTAGNDISVGRNLTVTLSSTLNEVYIDDTLQLNPVAMATVSGADLLDYHVLLMDPESGTLSKAITGSAFGGTPAGSVIAYYGHLANENGIPQDHGFFFAGDPAHPYDPTTSTTDYGWALANGATINGYETPDLTSKFLIGTSSADTATYPMSSTGGTEQVMLSAEQIPEHFHVHFYQQYATKNFGTEPSNIRPGRGDGRSQYGSTWPGHTKTKPSNPRDYANANGNTDSNIAGLSAVDIMPPYYALYYIIKLPSS